MPKLVNEMLQKCHILYYVTTLDMVMTDQRPLCTILSYLGRATYGDSRPLDDATVQLLSDIDSTTIHVPGNNDALICMPQVSCLKNKTTVLKPTFLTYVSGPCTTFLWLIFFYQKKSAFQYTSRLIYLYEGVKKFIHPSQNSGDHKGLQV